MAIDTARGAAVTSTAESEAAALAALAAPAAALAAPAAALAAPAAALAAALRQAEREARLADLDDDATG